VVARVHLGLGRKGHVMKTIKIRELRGSTLEQYARAGELVGLTRDRALIAVVVPMVQAWVEHIIEHNWSRVMQSAAAAEEDLNRETDLVSLDDVSRSEDHAVAASGEDPFEKIKQLTAAFDTNSKAGISDITSTNTIDIRELSAHRIEEAGQARELLVLTNDRVLIGIVVPISPRLVEFLISQNLSRVIYNIQVAEQRAADGAPFITLDEVLADNSSERTTRAFERRVNDRAD
jgi:hypothetical protein